MRKNKGIILAILVTCIASFIIRTYRLGSLPIILNRDEAALAYNAYLLKESGKDEWGKSWPFALQSFGDYKLPGYALFTIPILSSVGQQDWAVRLPAAIAGTGLIVVSYWFARAQKLKKIHSLWFVVIIATTPLFFFYSRIAFEAMVALTFFVGALTCLSLESTKHRMWLDLAAIVLALVAIFTYNTPLLLLPFVIVSLPLVRGIFAWRSWLLIVMGLSAVLFFGGYQLISLSSQKSGITIFQDETTWQKSVEYRNSLPGVLKPIVGNRLVFYGKIIAVNYAKSLSPTFLVAGEGGHPWHSLPNHGHVLAITYFLAVVGVLETLRSLLKKEPLLPRDRAIWMLWLLTTSLLPAVVTVDAPHATRSLLFFYMLSFFAALGIKTLLHYFFFLNRQAMQLLLVFALLSSFGWYVRDYFVQYPTQQNIFKPGFDRALKEVENKYPERKVAIVDDEGYHYVLLAWYLQLSPTDYFTTVVRQLPDKIGFRYGERVGRYHFIASPQDRTPEETVLVRWTGEDWNIQAYE